VLLAKDFSSVGWDLILCAGENRQFFFSLFSIYLPGSCPRSALWLFSSLADKAVPLLIFYPNFLFSPWFLCLMSCTRAGPAPGQLPSHVI
jgi:hypothetical protein